MKLHLKTQKYINSSNLSNYEIDEILNLHQKHLISIPKLISWVHKINKLSGTSKHKLSEILEMLIFVKTHKMHNKISFVFTFLKNGFTLDQCYWGLRCSTIQNVTIQKLINWTRGLNEGQVAFDCELDFISRIIKISRIGKDSMNQESLILRYGETLGPIKGISRRQNASYSKDYVEKLKGKEFAETAFKGRGASLENYVNRYGEQNGLLRWENYKKARKSTYEKNKNAGKDYNSFSLKTYVNKYGEIDGLKNWQKMRDKCNEHNSKDYLKKVHGDIVADEMAKNRWGNTSLDSFIKRYGPEEGVIKYQAFIQKLKDSANLECLIEKYGEEEGYKRYVRVAWKSNKASNISAVFFKLLEQSGISFNLESAVFLNREDRKLLGQKILFVDGKYENLIIEFFGDIWHANPKLFESTDCPNPFSDMTSAEIQDRDKKRISVLENKGFKVLTVWENDFKTNEKSTIASTLAWIKLNRNTNEISKNCQD